MKKKKILKNKKRQKNTKRKTKINFKKFNYRSVLRITLIFSALFLSFSFFYYYVLLMPTIEREKIEYQKQSAQISLNESIKNTKNEIKSKTEENKTEELSQELLLTNCLNLTKEAYLTVFEEGIKNCNQNIDKNKKYDCAVKIIDEVQMGLNEDKVQCLKNNQNSSGGLNVIAP